MGGGGKSADEPRSSKTASKMAEKLFDQTAPMRWQMVDNYENFLGGDYDVAQNPVWGAGRGVIENQFDVARENVIGGSPAGGALTDQLAGVQNARAGALGNLASTVSQDEYNKAYGMATGAPAQSMSTLSNIGGQQAMANAQQSSGKMGALGDIGMGTGMYLGSK